jgi:RHS repeat-associated protein
MKESFLAFKQAGKLALISILLLFFVVPAGCLSRVFAYSLPDEVALPKPRLQIIDEVHYVDKYFEIDKDGNLQNHVYLGNQKIVDINQDNETEYILTDHLGSPTIITNQQGEVVEINDYKSYGSINNTESTVDNAYKFTGKELDSETNLQYYGARYYDNIKGRFISVDPAVIYQPDSFLADPQQLNSYAYARNNPVVLIDPTGNFSISVVWDSFVDHVSSFISSIFNKTNSVNQIQTVISTHNQYSSQVQNIPTQETATWDPVTDQRIQQLDPRIQQPATNFINNTESELAIQLRVTDGYRTYEEQDILYAKGRTTEGPSVTGVRGGYSYHNYGLAVDVGIIENGIYRGDMRITPEIAKIGQEQGFDWGASFSDYPHFQMTELWDSRREFEDYHR